MLAVGSEARARAPRRAQKRTRSEWLTGMLPRSVMPSAPDRDWKNAAWTASRRPSPPGVAGTSVTALPSCMARK